MVVMLVYVAMRCGMIVTAPVPAARTISALVCEDIAQQAAGCGAAYCVERIAFRYDGAGGGAQTGADQCVVGLSVPGACAAGHSEGQQADGHETSKAGGRFHMRLRSCCNDG